MPLFRKLAALAAAGEAARRYAKKNPDQAARYLDQAAAFVDKQTKGKYTSQISGVAQRAKSVAGLPRGPVVDTSRPAQTPSATGTQPYPGTR